MESPPILQLDEGKEEFRNNVAILKNNFQKQYNISPTFAARVPGRVNLIGEHIDYCGYAVFPMAIDQEIIIVFAPATDATLELSNEDPQYENFTCDLTNIEIEKGNPQWFKYVLCGIKGILEQFADKNMLWKGMKARVVGSIPPSAGLSSSSALVCASALAITYVNGISVSKQQFADCCAKSERYIGTEGGGMDQAIAFLANKGTAKLIEFNPLRAHDIQLPSGGTFVIAHSLAEANKAATSHFNTRVMECRLAAKILAKLHGVNPDGILRLVDVQHALNKSLSEMSSVAKLYLHEEPYTKLEIVKLLEITEEELEGNILSENTRNVASFKLQQRAVHVYGEANRVCLFKDICSSGSPAMLKELGTLMSESHASCRDLYECSHPQLDKLVDMSKDYCLGARLTGAGWGGCVVALVEENNVHSFIDHLKDNYYQKLPEAQGRDLDSVVFSTQPNRGAAIFVI